MIELCTINNLTVIRKTDFGVYLAEDPDAGRDHSEINGGCCGRVKNDICIRKRGAVGPGEVITEVLLPGKEVPSGVKTGDHMEVFVYTDSEDRPVATVKKPYITLGDIQVLKVKQLTDIGAFLDWGLDKDLFLPFKEQTGPASYDPKTGKTREIAENDRIPVLLYVDKSGRPASTMRVYNHLSDETDYMKDSAVEGIVIRINTDMGVFLAIDGKYFGMIPIREIHDRIALGDRVFGRVSAVRDDGKLMISLSQKSYIQMDTDAGMIYKELEEAGGSLPFGDKSSPDDIKRRFSMSKNAFKKAIGHLYKEGKIRIENEKIVKILQNCDDNM